MRARWVELPDCQDLVDVGKTDMTAPDFWVQPEIIKIPLKADLSNAIIANCKGPYEPIPVVPPVVTPDVPDPVEKSVIYDPVWKTSLTIPDSEHQVSQLQHGKIDKTTETEGPKGDFWPKWLRVGDGKVKQTYQEAGEPWAHDGKGGINDTDAAMPINYNNSISANATVPFGSWEHHVDGAAGGVAYVTPTGISWGDGTHFVQPPPPVDPNANSTNTTSTTNIS